MPVGECSGLSGQPKGVNEVACITLHIEIVLSPQSLQTWESLDWLVGLKPFLNSLTDGAPRLKVVSLQESAKPSEGPPGCVGKASLAGIANNHRQILHQKVC